MRITICIPTYEMNGDGVDFLEYSFKILESQTFRDFNVVISDHSVNNEISDLTIKYNKTLDIKYIRNTVKRGSSSANINNAMKYADGQYIKILFQDDFLYGNNSLQIINDNLEPLTKWLISSCTHTYDTKNYFNYMTPLYHNNIHLGVNTISSPSVLTILNENPLFFDENLNCLMDCDYYKACFNKFGDPKILNKTTVVNRCGIHQVSNTLVTRESTNKELEYVKSKYKNG